MFPAYVMNYFWPSNTRSENTNESSLPGASYNNITKYLYLGNIDSMKYVDKFALVVNCTTHIAFPEQTKPAQVFIRIPVYDDPKECANLLKYIDQTKVLEKIHFCRMSSKAVLVHCHAGMQRSCAVIACYLMKYYKMELNDAIAFIKKKRPVAFYQTANFMNAMIEFQKSLDHFTFQTPT